MPNKQGDFFLLLMNSSYTKPPKVAIEVAVGGQHTLAIEDTDGLVGSNTTTWAWGNNSAGQLGDNTTVSKTTPVSVYETSARCFFSIGASSAGHSNGVDDTFFAWGWGTNTFGQLGDNSVTSRLTPVAVCGGHSYLEIRAGYQHSAAVDLLNGYVYCWGLNFYGELGDGTTTSRRTPKAVVTNGIGTLLSNVTTISSGYYHNLALVETGIGGFEVWAWGYNSSGQLGDNSTTSRLTAISISISFTPKGVYTGSFSQHSTAYGNTTNSGYAWGNNAYGQLGDNTTTARSTPVAICGGHSFQELAPGRFHTCGLDTLGIAWCWGSNFFGELGDNSTTSRSTPVAVCGGHTFSRIFADGSNTFAIDINNRLWGWGRNAENQIGNPAATSYLTPVCVCGF